MSKKWPIDFSTPQLLLAPMEGVVDAISRQLITALGGTDLCVTEFVRVTEHVLPKKVFYQYCPELQNQSRTIHGTPVIVQLLGSHPQLMAENAQFAIELGAAGIDLNFGCPAKTVNNHDGGASLLKIPQRIFNIIQAVRKAVPEEHSVSAKVRLGFDHKRDINEIARAAEDAGASWLTVHARTKVEAYQPPAHWEYIAQMREAVKIPVIANGEVWTAEDYWRCRQVSGCEHVMIGRGWVANPGLGLEIKKKAAKINWSQWQNYFMDFIHLSQNSKNSKYAVQRTKQLAKMMSQSYGEAHLLLQKIKTLQETSDILQILQNDFTPNDNSTPPPQLIVAKKFKNPILGDVCINDDIS